MKKQYISRSIEPRLKRLLRQFPSVVVTGPRQAGKSTLLQHLFKNTHRYLTFDDPAVRVEAFSDPQAFLERAGERVIIDEIQYVPELLSYVKMAIDAERHKSGRFIFTGSQQFPLIKNLGDSLAGRIAILELLPFSIEEKKRIPDYAKKHITTEAHFLHACIQGSFPELLIKKRLSPPEWYSSYLQTYLERDVRAIYNIGDLTQFQKFIQLLATRAAQILNLSSLSSDLGIAVNTIKRWLSVLESSRIIYLLPPYYQHFGKRITKSPKLYFLDSGLLCHLLGMYDRKYLIKTPFIGAIFENFCIQETVKCMANMPYRNRLFFLRTHMGLEIDLLIESGGTLHPIEFKHTRTPKREMGEPIQRFKKLFPRLSVEGGRLITLRSENESFMKDVSLQNLEEFLLSISSRVFSRLRSHSAHT